VFLADDSAGARSTPAGPGSALQDSGAGFRLDCGGGATALRAERKAPRYRPPRGHRPPVVCSGGGEEKGVGRKRPRRWGRELRPGARRNARADEPPLPLPLPLPPISIGKS